MSTLLMIVNIIIGMIGGTVITGIIVAADWEERPRRKRGRWKTIDCKEYVCSCCGYLEKNSEGIAPAYCCRCGADMQRAVKFIDEYTDPDGYEDYLEDLKERESIKYLAKMKSSLNNFS